MKISRQARWKHEQKQRGNCTQCGKPLDKEAGERYRCTLCQSKHVAAERKRYREETNRLSFIKQGGKK